MRYCIALFLLLAFFRPPRAQTDPCATRLTHGMAVRVAYDDGLGAVLHAEPRRTSPILDVLPEGRLAVVYGPAPLCAEGGLWWSVRLTDGRAGYLSETGGGNYQLEPFRAGVAVAEWQAEAGFVRRWWLDYDGTRVEEAAFVPQAPLSGTARDLWQAGESEAALQNCLPDPATLSPKPDRAVYPRPDGQTVLLLTRYELEATTCTGRVERFGTSYFSLLTASGEQALFAFSLHAEPPSRLFCQPPLGGDLSAPTYIDELAWAADGSALAFVARYLRDGAGWPCAFYHVFHLDLSNQALTPLGEGRRLAWGESLFFARIERTDPNTAGTQKFIRVRLPTFETIISEAPVATRFLADVSERMAVLPPQSMDGAAWVLCAGTGYDCDSLRLFKPLEASLSAAFPAPPLARLGLNAAGGVVLLGGEVVLWWTETGEALAQSRDGITSPLEMPVPIQRVLPLTGGLGAALEDSNGGWWLWDALTGALTPYP